VDVCWEKWAENILRGEASAATCRRMHSDDTLQRSYWATKALTVVNIISRSDSRIYWLTRDAQQ